jgi:hypothetical protein
MAKRGLLCDPSEWHQPEPPASGYINMACLFLQVFAILANDINMNPVASG